MDRIKRFLNERANRGEALERLPELVLGARSEPAPSCEEVIAACDELSKVLGQEHAALLTALGMGEERAARELELAKRMLSRGYLEERVRRELCGIEGSFTPYDGGPRVRHEARPLGMILHIAAGNAEAIPAFSVLEGLLTGNVNVLKLPSGDSGLSSAILQMLFEKEPKLEKRVFVFDIPSKDTEGMKKLIAPADAIAVWGGDEAVRSIRTLAGSGKKLIEWGHRISFAYVSGEASDAELLSVCRNICDTDQLLCSSCQGIFLDTDDRDELIAFAERFALLLEKTAAEIPSQLGEFARAQVTLELLTRELTGENKNRKVIKKRGCAVVADPDPMLEPSLMLRTPWVKPLKKGDIIRRLSVYGNRLQTAALICPKEQKRELENALLSAGVTRICAGERMSEGYCGMPHDGEEALRRYVRIVSVEE